MSDVSAFGVIHKSTRQERANRRAATGVGIGTTAGAATMGGLYTHRNYRHYKGQVKRAWDRSENRKAFDVDMENLRRQADWQLSGGYRRTKTWVPGSTGEKFESPKQQERVRRLRDLANHSSSKGTPEGESAARKLQSMGFDSKPKHENPGGWQYKEERVPRPENIKYERKPWKSPGAKTLLRNSTKLRGFKTNLGIAMGTGAVAGLYGGLIGGVRYHQKKEGIGPYGKKKR